ncbi:hypothetical protein [Pseudosporangium ferrugineum]|uniref:Uncharacterized protein n=1 Tax=Pseudosporangium ferrugineum TaxID=439699 RepID=A0A2T0SFB4_9ACTN|nr:hypothetical protein [Pseudosporangium ferrugineum]PRY32100.1 hypothetical protein CLV70_102311 [Pseudosporangium ferrugineum]
MKSSLSRVVVAAVAAIVITVSGTARPVQASVAQWAAVVVSVVQSLSGGDGGLERAKREIIAAVENSKQEILDHIDAIAAADVEACTQAAVTKVAQIDSMPGSLLGPFVNGAVDCAYLSTSYFNAVQGLPAADNIGKLMGVIYSIAMVGYAKYGLSTTALLDSLVGGYHAVVARLVPACSHDWMFDDNPRHIYEVTVTCQLYPGIVGTDTMLKGWLPGRPEPAIPYTAAIAAVDAQTSRGVAIAALPQLLAARG